MFYFYWKFFFSRKFFSLFFHRKHKNRMAVWVCVCVHWPMHSNVRLSGRWSYTSNTQFYVLNAKKWIHRIISQIYVLAMPKCVSLFFCLSAKYAVAVPSIAYYVYVGVNFQSNVKLEITQQRHAKDFREIHPNTIMHQHQVHEVFADFSFFDRSKLLICKGQSNKAKRVHVSSKE